MIRLLNVQTVCCSETRLRDGFEDETSSWSIRCNAVEVHPAKRSVLFYDLVDADGILVPDPRVFARFTSSRVPEVIDNLISGSGGNAEYDIIAGQVIISVDPPRDGTLIHDPILTMPRNKRNIAERLRDVKLTIATWETFLTSTSHRPEAQAMRDSYMQTIEAFREYATRLQRKA